MAQLNSPGVAVTVIDESFYAPAAPSTVPLIIVASEQDKANPSNTGIAPGTLKANAGKAYLITSQRDLATTFGVPLFKTDANSNPIHAGEQNEYGLQAAYSLLGVSNRAYIVRADIDLKELNAQAEAPNSEPENGTHWLDTANSQWGIFQWDNGPRSSKTGQTFQAKKPLVITDPTKVVNYASGNYAPKGSVGAIGDYAIVSLSDLDTEYSDPDVLYFKSPGNSAASIDPGTWVVVGSNDWSASWPVLVTAPYVKNATRELVIDSQPALSLTDNTAEEYAARVNAYFNSYGIFVTVKNNCLSFYLNNGNGGGMTISGDACDLEFFNIVSGYYQCPSVAISPHTSVPNFKSTNLADARFGARTGSVWVKTTEPAGGAKLIVKKYNQATKSFDKVPTPLYSSGFEAIYNLDRAGGGLNIGAGALYCHTTGNNAHGEGNSFKLYRKAGAGANSIVSSKLTTGWYDNDFYELTITEGRTGTKNTFSAVINFDLNNNAADADVIAAAINASNDLKNIQASVDAQNRLVISHILGGDFTIEETGEGLLDALGITANSNVTAEGDGYLVSLWEPLRFTANKESPSTLTKNGTLWYSSVIDEIDIMVHDGEIWSGYRNVYEDTDPMGPIVSATKPLTQSDGTSPLADNDLWIDTSDLENFPKIYRFDLNKPGPIATRWVELDSTDQSSQDGVLFHDARYNTSGMTSDVPGVIEELLLSDYVDFDAPDPALYPKGMLLWNLRRSGFNVKRFVQNYVDINDDNVRYDPAESGGESMGDYYPHRWVTASANQDDGSGSFGRKAQRKLVVQALQATINSSTDVREEARVFNLIATPGYPELIGEMITLNYDRALTAFVLGDTPARLLPDATSLMTWGTNLRLAVEDNDIGAPSYDEYLALFYPWGFTSDNFGNNVVVPPSHMMLRTIALSDNVSYPWFAPAGTRRGGITNATSVGYIDSEGEFKTLALNNGQRDTLYDAKINPITFFTGVGLVNYGQKTRAKNASALDRINVARLIVYMRRQLDILAKPYVFEPNDKITRDEIKNSVESFMLELVGQRALYDYIVVCDDSNNTPSRIDKNELYVDVAIVPVKAVEFIYIPLRIKSTTNGLK